MYIDPAGFFYNEFYLYSKKHWEMASSGVSVFNLASGIMQNAPVVVTSSGSETSRPIDPWAQTNGLGRYTKVGYGYFSRNTDGSIDTGENEFALDPTSSGRLIFNKSLAENVYIEYEGGPSGYYIYDSVDLNPVRNQIDSGFIHCSTDTDPASISLTVVHSTLVADGLRFTRMTATLLDSNYDRVPNRNITFSIPDDFIGSLTPVNGNTISVGPSGLSIQTQSLTDSRGRAKALYTPRIGQPGTQLITASCSDDISIYAYATVTQSYTVADPFILDESLLDSGDYLS